MRPATPALSIHQETSWRCAPLRFFKIAQGVGSASPWPPAGQLGRGSTPRARHVVVGSERLCQYAARYGQKFRALHVGNLGVEDAWDVLSGVDYLIGLGIRGYDAERRDGMEIGRAHV